MVCTGADTVTLIGDNFKVASSDRVDRDLVTLRWTSRANPNAPVYSPGTVTSINGIVYTIGQPPVNEVGLGFVQLKVDLALNGQASLLSSDRQHCTVRCAQVYSPSAFNLPLVYLWVQDAPAVTAMSDRNGPQVRDSMTLGFGARA